jgi:hypothetical protein
MRRFLVLAGVIAAGLLAAGPTSAAARAQRGFAFELRAGGFLIEAQSAVGSGRMRLLLDRQGQVAYYYAAARVGSGTVRARFGKLGSLDLRFRPDRGEGQFGCDAVEGGQLGTFRGTIAFRGEHDYADVDADRARGYFEARPADDCPNARARSSAVMPPRPLGPIAETGAELRGSAGTWPFFRLFYFFSENRTGGVRAAFNAFRGEKREGMLIERGAQVLGGASSFAWDLGAGTARVEPPAPFSGRAFYRPGSVGRKPRWTGSLRVPILGGKPMRLTGTDFVTHFGGGA